MDPHIFWLKTPWLTYILKASLVTPTIPHKNLSFPQICPKMPRNGPKITLNDPKWPKYDPKWHKKAQEWPKNDPKWPNMAQKWPAIFCGIFFDWKGGSANFFAFRMYGGAVPLNGRNQYLVSSLRSTTFRLTFKERLDVKNLEGKWKMEKGGNHFP